jgi:hypothetical protein
MSPAARVVPCIMTWPGPGNRDRTRPLQVPAGRRGCRAAGAHGAADQGRVRRQPEAAAHRLHRPLSDTLVGLHAQGAELHGYSPCAVGGAGRQGGVAVGAGYCRRPPSAWGLTLEPHQRTGYTGGVCPRTAAQALSLPARVWQAPVPAGEQLWHEAAAAKALAATSCPGASAMRHQSRARDAPVSIGHLCTATGAAAVRSNPSSSSFSSCSCCRSRWSASTRALRASWRAWASSSRRAKSGTGASATSPPMVGRAVAAAAAAAAG